MQKKLLAAVVSSLIAGQAMAVTVADNGTSKFEIGGYVGSRYQSEDIGTTEAIGDSSRINIAGESKLNEDFTAFAKIEYGFSNTNSGKTEDDFTARLGYVGVKSDKFGSLSLGKQWSTYSKVSTWTDMFATTGGDASGTYNNGDFNGTGRADDAVQYNVSVKGLNVSAQLQTADADAQSDRSNGTSFAASYDLPMGLSVGAAWNRANMDNGKPDAKAAIAAVKYSKDALYAAFSYGEYRQPR